MNYSTQIKDYIDLERSILEKLDVNEIDRALNLLVETLNNRRLNLLQKVHHRNLLYRKSLLLTL